MPRISFAGFTDPVRRPRYLIWTSVLVITLAVVMVAALSITSTRWFCSEACHKVQDDTITAYNHSPHSEISCMACHMPANANPVIFVLHKAEALGELYLTVRDDFELPLNGESEYALEMKSTQCTQCHDVTKRVVTPSAGIIIKHDPHTEAEVACAVCHNRVAHVEDFELELRDPNTGERNRKHEDFMKMTACFRCHSQGETPKGGIKAPGRCDACHTAGFQLKPPSHLQPGFFPKGHAKLGQAEFKRAEALAAEFEGGEGENTEGEKAESGKEEPVGMRLVKVETINECQTCHKETFCVDCHKLPMPHPADFKKGHGKLGKADPTVCANCHGDAKRFCDECHHGSSLEWDYQTDTPWRKQHPKAVATLGTSSCFECHKPTYCSGCHVSLATGQ
jgi:hypothetical protein